MTIIDRESMTFSVKACSDAHIVMSYVPGLTLYDSYEVALGVSDNHESVIMLGRGGEELVRESTPNLLDCNQDKSFWISWPYTDTGIIISAGSGSVVGTNSFISTEMTANTFKVNSVSVSTGGPSNVRGEWEFTQGKFIVLFVDFY